MFEKLSDGKLKEAFKALPRFQIQSVAKHTFRIHPVKSDNNLIEEKLLEWYETKFAEYVEKYGVKKLMKAKNKESLLEHLDSHADKAKLLQIQIEIEPYDETPILLKQLDQMSLADLL